MKETRLPPSYTRLILLVTLITIKYVATAPNDLGMVTGGIYEGVEQSFQLNAENIFCEYVQLGVSWIRIQSDWPGTEASVYQSIVQMAHANGIKVNLLVPAQYCGSDSDPPAIDSFISSYLSHLEDLRNSIFNGPSSVDAYEIANEPNIEENACPDGQLRFRVSPNAFAYLLRRTYQWKQDNNVGELIISGGILNTYLTESFWPQFFASGAWFNYLGSRPFDYFGIHPYDPYSIDQNCINSGSTNCFDSWYDQIYGGLLNITQSVNSASETAGTQLFVTEFGLQTSNTCSSNSNCVITTDQQSSGMQMAMSAIRNSGVVSYSTWYDYRDDSSQFFGIRGNWNGTYYPPKQPTWSTFQSLAGGSGSSNPDACW